MEAARLSMVTERDKLQALLAELQAQLQQETESTREAAERSTELLGEKDKLIYEKDLEIQVCILPQLDIDE